MTNQQRGVIGHRTTPYTISITFDDGNPVVITTDNPNFNAIAAKLKSGDYRNLYAMCNPAEGIKSYFNGKVQVKSGSIYVNGKIVDSSIVKTILQLIKDGAKPEPLLRFLALLEENPSMHSRNQLWDFIRQNDIVIYEGGPVKLRNGRNFDATGYLVLYKGVRDNYMDEHTGKFLNKPGLQLEMPRPKVDDDQSRACSAGFHAGAFPYVKSFGSRKLIVLVNPADIVSVPHDASCQKIRCCRYTVLKEVEAKTFAQIDGATFKEDGLTNFFVSFEVKSAKGEQTAVVRALDVEHAADLLRDEFDVKSIRAIAPVESIVA